jgi:hypothetical protein
LNRSVIQRAKDKAASGDMSRQAADRLAIERDEDDGMIVRQGVTSNVQNSKEIHHAIPTR